MQEELLYLDDEEYKLLDAAVRSVETSHAAQEVLHGSFTEDGDCKVHVARHVARASCSCDCPTAPGHQSGSGDPHSVGKVALEQSCSEECGSHMRMHTGLDTSCMSGPISETAALISSRMPVAGCASDKADAADAPKPTRVLPKSLQRSNSAASAQTTAKQLRQLVFRGKIEWVPHAHMHAGAVKHTMQLWRRAATTTSIAMPPHPSSTHMCTYTSRHAPPIESQPISPP